MPIPLYLDCDTGVDDSVALAYLLASPDVEIVGIGTVSGNISAGEAARNTLDLLELAGRRGIPVAVGAHDHFDHPYAGGAPHVHGRNGVGDVALPTSGDSPDERSAVELLLDLSHEYAERLRILAIGPLTNLGRALEADPGLAARIADVVVMGGAAMVPGNITPVAEANIANDPQAAAAVFAADWDLLLVPLDATMEHTLGEDDRQLFLASANPFVHTLGEVLDGYFDFYVPLYGHRTCAMHDPLAAVLATGAVEPSAFAQTPVTVDTGDGPGRGQTIVDLRLRRRGLPRAADARTRVVLEVDAPTAPLLVDTIIEAFPG